MRSNSLCTRRRALKTIGSGITGLTLAGQANALDQGLIQIVHTARFWDYVDTWRKDAAADRVKERLNERVDKYNHYVEIKNATISQEAIEHGKEIHDSWHLAMNEALKDDIIDGNSLDGVTFIVLDYIPDPAYHEKVLTESANTPDPPAVQVVFANYEPVVSGDLYDFKMNGDREKYIDGLPATEVSVAGNTYQWEPKYDVSEMSFWIYRRLIHFIDGDIEQSFASPYVLNT